jgi:hypothetical protein
MGNDRVQHDIGTLWTLKRGESTARCALVALTDGLELRVLMDGAILRSERCDWHEQAFELAERWRVRMTDRGWAKLVPGAEARRARGRVLM